MIPRMLANSLRRWQGQYPVITIIGPRQSGKTTLARATFSDLPYVNLEDLQERQFAVRDPKGFLHRIPNGAVIDEIQRAPMLLGQIQVQVDADSTPGRFIVTGSNQHSLRHGISQTLAGRTAIGELYPFTVSELGRLATSCELDELLVRGFYPRIWDRNLPAAEALGFYVQTYLERDLRELQTVKDLVRFETFLRLCAGRTAQVLNLSSLASDAGISPNTAKDWLSLLETGFIVFRLQPYYRNIAKRLVKSPKLFFWDVGLASWLLGIRKIEHVALHPLRGNLVENLVVVDILKSERHWAGGREFCFYRDNHGTEVDLLALDGPTIDLVEIKSGRTVTPELWKQLPRVRSALNLPGADRVIFGGEGAWVQEGIEIAGWREYLG